MDFLKDVLGEDLFKQVSDKLKGNDKVKLANLVGGEYVLKGKHDAEIKALTTDRDSLKEQNKTVSTQLTELKDSTGDVNDLKKQIAKLTTDQTEITKKHDETQKALKKDYGIELGIRDFGGKNPKTVAALLNREAISIDGDNIIGLNEQLTKIKESDEYLFGEAKPTNTDGGNPPNTEEGDDGEGPSVDAMKDAIHGR